MKTKLWTREQIIRNVATSTAIETGECWRKIADRLRREYKGYGYSGGHAQDVGKNAERPDVDVNLVKKEK